MGHVQKVLFVIAAALLGGCATGAMRQQAGVLSAAGEQLERETAAFASARTGVVQLRQRSLVEQQAEVAERGQQNAATLAQWRVAKTDDRERRLALFEGVRAASEAMYEVRDQSLMWEETVLASGTALAVDRAALHRFVLQLVRLAQPGTFVAGVKFYVEYGAQVGGKVDAGLKDVLAGAAAAAKMAEETGSGSGGGSGPGPAGPTTPVDPGRPIGPTTPVDPGTPRPTLPIVPTTPPADPPRPTGAGDVGPAPKREPIPG